MRSILLSAAIVGVIIMIPVCALIYQSVGTFETGIFFKKRVKDEVEKISKVYGILDDSDPLSVYPIPRRLTNVDGRIIESVITGKFGETLKFLSLANNRNYEYSINHLSEKDMEFIRSLPEYDKSPDSYPVIRKITLNGKGSFVAKIEGRSQFDFDYSTIEHSEVQRAAINNLSPEDRQFLFRLPNTK
jgi:hypothetical protein